MADHPKIDANDLERMAKERPDECFLKGSGVLKLTGAVRQLERERDELRGLWLEWLSFNYDSPDLLRRVKLAVHGPLRKPGNAGVPGRAHVLYTDADKDRPDVICDSNGQVTLGLCKVCGRGEAELEGPCPGPRGVQVAHLEDCHGTVCGVPAGVALPANRCGYCGQDMLPGSDCTTSASADRCAMYAEFAATRKVDVGVSSPSVTEQEVTRALERHCLRTDSAEARKDMRKALEGFVSDRTAGVQEGRYQASCTKDADES